MNTTISGRRLRSEVMLLCTAAVLFVALLCGTVAYHLLKSQLEQQTMLNLHHLANERAAKIDDYLNGHLKRLAEAATSVKISAAMDKLEAVFAAGTDSAVYRQVDSDFRPMFHSMLEYEEIYDLFLIARNGDIVFTMDRESDFGTNLVSSAYRDTPLASVWRNAQDNLSPDISRFAYYAPSKRAAMFMAAPIIYAGRLYGVLAIQLDPDAFYRVTGDLGGLGDSGEIVLGSDHGGDVLITAPTRQDPDSAFTRRLNQSDALAKTLQQAAGGHTGHGMLIDQNGVPVLAAWEYLPGLDWGMVAKIDQQEALRSLNDIAGRLIAAIGAALLLVLVLAAWRSGRIVRPLQRLAEVADNLAARERFDIDAPVNVPIREINQLSKAFNRMAAKINDYQLELEEKVAARTAELARLKVAIDQSQEIVMITDRDTVIEYVNPAFERISGYSAGEAIGCRANLVKSGKMSQAFYVEMWDTILSGRSWQANFINRNRQGEIYEVAQAISPITSETGSITGFVSVQRDITDEREKQQQMEHSQRLESLGVLAGGIAHDFNNLLTAILGNAGLAQRKIDAGSPVAPLLNHIVQASEQAADLCKQMLAYSGKGRFVVEKVNLNQLVNEILKLLRVSIGKKVRLHTDLGESLPDIAADRAQMQQVIMNLVINASEAIGDENGNIAIHTSVMSADESYLKSTYITEPLPAGDYVYFEVSDDGCGMDEGVQEKLFDPFFTTKFTGRGLGMSAILGIVRGHSGAIKIYSEPGRGTTFKLLFPVASETAEQPTTAALVSESKWIASGKVLVVDDEEHIRRTASLMLREIGFEVVCAEDGAQGVELFRQQHGEIDIVLLDMTMPVMDGKTAFRELRRIDPAVRVILSSGYNEQDATSHFAGKGLAGFIQKPYRMEMLRRKLQEILAG